MTLLDQKVENAVAATQALIRLLERCGENGWSGSYNRIWCLGELKKSGVSG